MSESVRDDISCESEKLTFAGVDDGHNETINSENTSHDTGNERFEHQVAPQDTNDADSDSGFGSAVGSTKVSEHESCCESHVAEEGILVDSI